MQSASDPYFSRDEIAGKKDRPAEDAIRSALLPTDVAFRVAGTGAMVLGASVFALFGIPVSAMLKAGAEPGGILLVEKWEWDLWVARMASVLVLAASGTVLGWGLKRFRPWARWSLLGLGVVGLATPIVASMPSLWRPEPQEPGELSGLACAISVVVPSAIAACWAACSPRTGAVFGVHRGQVVELDCRIPAKSRRGAVVGVGMALAMLVLIWTLLFLWLGALAAFGIIRSI